MRIAFVSSGDSIHVKKIANKLVEWDHDITLFTLPDNNKLLPDFDRRVEVVKLPVAGKKGYYLNVPYLKHKIKKGDFDIVNCHYASGYGTMARLAGIHPLSLSVFGADVYDYPFKSDSNMKRVIRNLENADVITSTSHVMAAKVREFYHGDKAIEVTPFGVDLNVFYPRNVDKDDYFEFGIVKKIEKKYGIDLLLKAFKQFQNRMPEVKSRLVIYGRGSVLDEYKTLADSLGLDSNRIFKGFIQNELVPDVLSHMDVACFPSICSESFGVAVVEAMACAIPVIVSDSSGFTEVVIDNETGFIIPKNSEDALTEAMIRMYSLSQQERERMGNNGVERVKKYYNFDDNIKIYEKAISNAIK